MQEELARKTRKDASIILAGAGEHAERELFRRAGRRHSKLQDVEYQCWVFRCVSRVAACSPVVCAKTTCKLLHQTPDLLAMPCITCIGCLQHHVRGCSGPRP